MRQPVRKLMTLICITATMALAACTPADEEYCQSFGVAGTAEFGKCLDFYHRESAAFGGDRAVCDGEADYTYPTTLYDYGHTEHLVGGFVPTPYGGRYIGGQTIVVQPDYRHNAEVDRLRMRIIEPCMQARGWNSSATWQAGRRVLPSKSRGAAKPIATPKPPQLQPTGSLNLPWLQ